MADKKISALTAASIPLVGTEVLPLVQSGVTVKVANNDLRPKQIQSNATSGVLQVAGPAAASTRVMTTPDANFSAARIDAAQSFTGDQTLATGNLVIGTAGKGIDFSADPSAAGMTSELLDDYEEGTWTPTVLGSTVDGTTTYSVQNGVYVKVGNMVYCQALLIWTAVTGTGNLRFGGLPFTSVNLANSQHSVTFGVVSDIALIANNIMTGILPASSSTIAAYSTPVGGGAYEDVAIDGAGYVSFSIVYRSA